MALGIVGGSGVYDPKFFSEIEEIKTKTPYGMPSDLITKAKLGGKTVYILPRHGRNHQFNPTEVPYKANIWALKELGVTKLFSVSAVGSLDEDYRPGDLVFTDQFIDMTRLREQTFYKSIHLSVAEPFCPNLRKKLSLAAAKTGERFHETGTCVVIEGPRFSTKAESRLFRSWHAHIINMTLVPEAVLAREAQICYANIAMVTDYDVWKDEPVSHQRVLRTMEENLSKVQKLLMSVLPDIDDKKVCVCNEALKDASM